VDVEAIHAAGGSRVTQALEGGPEQGRAAVALVDEGPIVRQHESIGGDTFA